MIKKKGMKKMMRKYYKLIWLKEGVEYEKNFYSFEALKSELEENVLVYFSFLKDIEGGYSKVIPNFSSCESIEDINSILFVYGFGSNTLRAIEAFGE